MNESEFRDKWAHRVTGEGALDAGQVEGLVIEIVLGAVRGVEFLTVVDLLPATMPDDAAEFIHDLITHPMTLDDIRKALT